MNNNPFTESEIKLIFVSIKDRAEHLHLYSLGYKADRNEEHELNELADKLLNLYPSLKD